MNISRLKVVDIVKELENRSILSSKSLLVSVCLSVCLWSLSANVSYFVTTQRCIDTGTHFSCVRLVVRSLRP